jgi:hypothetical protein
MFEDRICQFEIIRTRNEYADYLERNKKKFGSLQLRYGSNTAKNGENSAILRVPYPGWAYTLLKPYYFYGSHDIKLITKKYQSIEAVVFAGLQKDLGILAIDSNSFKKVGEIEVKNTNKLLLDVEFHKKHLFIISNFEQYDYRMYREKYFSPGEEPVWVSNFILEHIFNEEVTIKGEIKYHPQKESHAIFKEAIALSG